MSELKENVIEALKDVYDPEIPINVYDLGLIYEVNVKDDGNVDILMTLTSPTCPTADFIKEMIHDAIAAVDGVNSVDIELTFEPLWTPDRITKEAREELGFEEAPTEDLSVKNVFEGGEEIKLCFNCGATENDKPLLNANYKKEQVKICTSCISKF